MFFFDPRKLLESADRFHADYLNATPFPHIVLDQFFPEETLNPIYAEFLSPQEGQWTKRYHENSQKLELTDETQMGEATRHFLAQLNSSAFLIFLERLTGITGLIPDPHFSGGGLHQIERGGFLNIHADFNYLQRLGLYRRLNLLLYLNKDWKEEYGGHLELWSRDMSRCEKRLLPVFNRCVIFNTTDRSFHGHPEPVACPEGMTRKSLALYYYSAVPADSKTPTPHSTLYQKQGSVTTPRRGFGAKKILRFFFS